MNSIVIGMVAHRCSENTSIMQFVVSGIVLCDSVMVLNIQ